MSKANMKTAILLRGPSGAGKSYLTEKVLAKQYPGLVLCSADKFFMKVVEMFDEDGREGTREEYQFDFTKLPEAHSNCMSRFLEALSNGQNVVVDNTFIKQWEMQNYLKAAILAGYSIRVIEFRVTTIKQLELCIARNQHKVPADAVSKMVLGFEPLVLKKRIDGVTVEQVPIWEG